MPHERIEVVRVLSGVIAAVVVVDALSVGAPGLALMAVPFAIIAARYTHGSAIGSAVVVVFCALYAVLGINYAVSNGLDAPIGDLLFAYVGSPLAVAAGAMAVRQALVAHSHQTA
jgi:hypothetical protein